jgi:hypothetical protein
MGVEWFGRRVVTFARGAPTIKQWSLDARSWRQVSPPFDEMRKTTAYMRGLKKVLVPG